MPFGLLYKAQAFKPAMSLPESLSISNSTRYPRQPFNLSQEEFVAKLDIAFEAVNCCRWRHRMPSGVILKLVEDLLKSLGEPGRFLLKHYFLKAE